MAPRSKSSASPAPKRGLQARAKSEEQVVWCGREKAGQDVCIRLVRNTINDEVDDDRTLAKVMVHESRLKTFSRYFAAVMDPDKRWKANPKGELEEYTFHVDGNVRLYINCFSRMYSLVTVGFRTVRYSLQLLAVATHLACDDMMRSICRYLAVLPWSDVDQMRIRSAVNSKYFPRGYAKDLLERLEMRKSAEALRPLIKRCMNSSRSARDAKELLGHVLRTARREQDRNPTPTFEQEVVSIINEEFKLLLVEASRKMIAAGNVRTPATRFMNMEPKIHGVLDILMETDMADEGVTWFWLCHPFLNPPGDRNASELDEDDVARAVKTLAWQYVGMVRGLVARSRFVMNVTESVRNTMLINWLPLLDWLYKNGNRSFGRMSLYREAFERLKRILPSNTPYSQELQEIINRVLTP